MSGGKGGSSSAQVQLPAWLEEAAQENLARARYAAQIGYTPYYGPDVAALTAPQQQAMQATGAGMQAFGLAGPSYNPLAGVPTPQTFMGGIQGYSSGGLYDQAISELQQRRPAQYDAISGMFIDPATGKADVQFTSLGSIAGEGASAGVQMASDYSDPNSDYEGTKGDYYDFISSAPVEYLSREFGEPKEDANPILSKLGQMARKKVTDYYNPPQPEPISPPLVTYTPVIPVSAGGSYDDYNDYNNDDSGSSDFSNSSYNAGGGVSTSGGNLGGGYVYGGW